MREGEELPGAAMAILGDRPRAHGVRERCGDRIGQSGRAPRRHEPAGLLRNDEFSHTSYIGRNDRRPHRKRLQNDVGKSLGERGIDHEVGAGEQGQDRPAETGQETLRLQALVGDLPLEGGLLATGSEDDQPDRRPALG